MEEVTVAEYDPAREERLMKSEKLEGWGMYVYLPMP